LFDAGGEEYTATGGQLLEPGWHTVYPFSEAKETTLPPFVVGEHLPVSDVRLDEKATQPPARYTQSKLIQRMEELGLGTKSTRHEVIAKLVSRKYVEGTPLHPTLVGRVVTESLEQHADAITKPDMTRTLEAHTSRRSAMTSGAGPPRNSTSEHARSAVPAHLPSGTCGAPPSSSAVRDIQTAHSTSAFP
jgi:DNA topoisomerase IA